MENTVFVESMDGLVIDEVVRDYEFSMPIKHFHETYELYFLLEGERYYFIDRETYHVKKGEVVLVGRQQIHKTGQAENSFHDRILVQMDGRVLDPYLKNVGLPSLESFFSEYYGVARLPEAEWEQAKRLLFSIREELKGGKKRYEVMVRLMLSQLLLLIYRVRKAEDFYEPPQTVQTVKHQKVHEVAEYLTGKCETEESLEEIAARFFISKSYLSRIFRQVTGFSVNEYKNLARIKRAEKLLENSAYSVTEISERLGFESVTYFERVFKRHTDDTPLQYRKKSRR